MPKDPSSILEGAAAPPSPSEEMYLVTLAVAAEAGAEGPLPLADLARSLGISPVSANQMVRRLAGRGLLDYHPYRGASLTAAGRQEATRVLRGRRLWTAFLTDCLGFPPDEADALACSLEHVTPPEAAARLARFLGEPGAGRRGRGLPARSAAGAGRSRR